MSPDYKGFWCRKVLLAVFDEANALEGGGTSQDAFLEGEYIDVIIKLVGGRDSAEG